MHLCPNGHAWYDAADAAKCCNPNWRRVLLLGRDALAQSETPVQLERSTGAVYGRRWESVP